MTEAQHQAMVMKWSRQPEIRSRWPELALLYHIPNGGTRDANTITLGEPFTAELKEAPDVTTVAAATAAATAAAVVQRAIPQTAPTGTPDSPQEGGVAPVV